MQADPTEKKIRSGTTERQDVSRRDDINSQRPEKGGGESAPAMISARDVEIGYGDKGRKGYHPAIVGLNLQANAGEFICIVGPSGCGKSSLLMAMAGLKKISVGSLSVNGKAVDRPSAERAVVFQSPALLPWRTVEANVTYGLELRGRFKSRRKEVRELGRKMLALVGLEGYEDKYPSQLSGGMKQRVNLARALTMDPEVLLLDEPFAALDAQTREVMQEELLRIWEQDRKTAVFVTHQISEAIILADRVVVLSANPGRVVSDFRIELGRPRAEEVRWEPAFRDYEREIRNLIRS